MAKGFLSGVIVGGVVSVAGLSAVSLILPPVGQNDLNGDVVAEMPATPSQEAAPDVAPVAPVAPAEMSEDTPSETPETAAPDSGADSGTDTSTDTGADMQAPSDAAMPDTNADTPAADAASPAKEVPQDGDMAPGMEPDGAPQDVDPANDPTFLPTHTPEPLPTPDLPAPAPEQDNADVEGETGMEPDVTPAPITEDVPDSDGAAGAAPGATEAEAQEAEAEAPPTIKSDPVAPIQDQAPDVTTGRLPSIDATPDDAAEDEEAPTEAAENDSPLAIERNALPFDNPDARPLMSIVLKDMGPEREKIEGLSKLPFPVSVIVSAIAPDADEAIAFYKKAGLEVVVEANLPPGATPVDAEVNLQVQEPLINKGTAVYLAPESAVQSDAQLAKQVAEILIVSGHGLLTDPQGLNTGHKTALKAGVASGLVFRDLDGDGQTGKVIRRFLDNAAFKARQEEGVILIGRAQPDTVQALVEWSLGSRVNSVAMAPLSATLLGGL
ncbi:divergent polysaccharide deacetylase family protein [Aliiroseovarius marinus]|uniref:divergent polysaccharide deacetylase family protein n=1 Tax=Aliiroseovarius marinus TaxID=2500159 RepID=UPI003D7D9C06